ncbi:MAG: hypothetical protein H6624_12995 [Bdellovibrionaceae bacterium]|nr:hypothetical protein [Bdellovibrionales bacterium]MCB9085260.1 hypothetical protein [Pseudobdellovibrionaceae bacterium]
MFLLLAWAFVLPPAFADKLVWDQSEEGSLWLYPECADKFILNCETLPPVLATKIDQCKIAKVANKCDEYFKGQTEVREYVKSCTPEEICAEYVFESAYKAYGCTKGFGEVAWDMAVGIVDLGKMLIDHVSKTARQKSAFFAYCEKSVDCKRALVADHPAFSRYSDEQLQEMSAFDLYTRAQHYEEAKRRSDSYQFAMKSWTERQKILDEKAKKAKPPETPFKIEALAAAATKYLEDKNIKLACFNAEARTQLVCYGIFSILDPAAVAGATIKSAKLARWIKRLDPPKWSDDVGRRFRSRATSGSRDVLTEAVRSTFIKDYAETVFTTPDQNRGWIRAAQSTRAGSGTLFFDVENAVLKQLNDGLKNKNLVTALTNRHKELLLDKMTALEKRYPGLKVERYSDFKSTRFAFSGEIPPNLNKELNKLYKEVNDAFFSDEKVRAIVRDDDLTGDWFRAGVGETADQATTAARYARRQKPDQMFVQSFQSRILQRRLEKDRVAAGNIRLDLEARFKDTGIMTKADRSDVLIPDEGVFDLVRKIEDPAELKAAIEARYGIKNLEARDIEDFKRYSALVDEFSPGIHVAKREVVNFDEAVHGGLSIDFAGMGSHNARATAEALAASNNLDEAVDLARVGEQKVTKVFNQKKETLTQIMNDVFPEGTVRTICTGDDCAVIPVRPLNPRDKKAIMSRIATQSDPASVRLSFIPDNVTVPLDRTLLGTHGESIEKALRKSLSGHMEPAKLKGLLFAVDMQGTQAGTGKVGLLIESAPSLRLSTSERRLIENRFKDAIESVNQSLIKQGDASAYSSSGVL